MSFEIDPDGVPERLPGPDHRELDELIDRESLCWPVVEDVKDGLGQGEGQGTSPGDSVTVTPVCAAGLFADEYPEAIPNVTGNRPPLARDPRTRGP